MEGDEIQVVRVEGEWPTMDGSHQLISLQVVIERWRRTTPEDFWKEFSHDDGTRMTFTGIIACLRQQRLAQDRAIAEQAHREYGDTFQDHFTYRRGSQVLIMSDPVSIAKRYRSLHS
jgi:hypothetical protein